VSIPERPEQTGRVASGAGLKACARRGLTQVQRGSRSRASGGRKARVDAPSGRVSRFALDAVSEAPERASLSCAA
jgi:hypothetical protein